MERTARTRSAAAVVTSLAIALLLASPHASRTNVATTRPTVPSQSPTHSDTTAEGPVLPGGDRATGPATKVANGHPVSDTPSGKLPASARAQRRSDGGVPKGYRAPKPGDREDEEEVENGESKNPTSTRQLTYRGGAVQTAPRIYLVLWGANWFTNGDPNGVAGRLHAFYGGVGGSAYASVLTQFSSNYGSFTNPTGQYQGWIQDTTAIPAKPTKTDIANAAKRAAARVNDYSYNSQFVIAMPWGYRDQFSIDKSFCAWHDYVYATTTQWITYTSLPYIPYEDAIGVGCGKNWVNAGSAGVLDGVTILASHEYAETVNDPSLSSWLDADNFENADKCSWTNLANRQLSNGYWFPVQPYWSNAWRTTYGYGCYYG